MVSFKKQISKQALIIGIGATVCVGYFVLLRMAIVHELAIAENLNGQRASLIRASDNLAQLIKEKQEAQPFVETLQSMIPRKDSLFSISKDIEQIAKDHSVSAVITFSQEDTRLDGTKETVRNIRFVVTFDGGFNDILKTLEVVEKKYTSLSFDSFDVSRRDVEKSPYRALVRGVIYYLP